MEVRNTEILSCNLLDFDLPETKSYILRSRVILGTKIAAEYFSITKKTFREYIDS